VILLDTCAVIYWTLDRDRLTSKARAAIDRESVVALSSISIWEIGIKVKREKLVLPLALQDYVGRLKKVERAVILPVDEFIWLTSLSLSWEQRDPADRTIVATAMRQGCRLVTSDRTIASFYPKCVW
jgi:PIN domain nuclease of toxin-antitoxin system